MAPQETKTDSNPRWKMPTVRFLSVWKLNMDKTDSWNRFVVMCFDEFEKDNPNYSDDYKGYDEWNPKQEAKTMSVDKKNTDEEKYQFLSEKCYSKCQSLRSKMVKKNPEISKRIRLPDGYLRRAGEKTSKSKRMDADEMIKMLLG
jgi:hypothetical protein